MKTKISEAVLWRQLDFIVTHGSREYGDIPLQGRELDRLIEEAVLIAEQKDELKELRLGLGHALASKTVSLRDIVARAGVTEEQLRQIARRMYEINFPNDPYDPEKEPVEIVESGP